MSEQSKVSVSIGDSPEKIGPKRVLGIVPGKPAAGERKEPDKQDLVMVWPHLLVRHAVAALGTLLTVLVIAVFFDAPLLEFADPNRTPNPEKAPWYFAGLQELLSRFHPLVAGVLLPGGIIVALIALPFIDRSPHTAARFRKVAVVTFTLFMVAWILLTIIGFAFRGPDWGWVWPWNEWYGDL